MSAQTTKPTRFTSERKTAATSLLGLADTGASLPNADVPGWMKFRHGTFECTVVADGPLPVPGIPSEGFPTADTEELTAFLKNASLPIDKMTLDQNILIVNTGSYLVLIDTGVGANKTLGSKYFGSQTGQLVPRLKAAGIDPNDVDIVAITHAHPDHCWGLVDEKGGLLFPNAKVAVSQIEYEFWTDDANASKMPEGLARDMFHGAAFNLKPVRHRLIALKDGCDVVPGITALATPGHSPDHMIFAVTSEGKTIVAIGDLSHHHILLLKRPMWHFKYDSDPMMAAETRVKIFDMIVKEQHQVAAFHFPFPGLGCVAKEEDGYGWVPKNSP